MNTITIAEQVLAHLDALANYTNTLSNEEISNECFKYLESLKHNELKNDRVTTLVFEDDSTLIQFFEEDYGGSITWSLDDEYEYFVEIQFNDYDDEE